MPPLTKKKSKWARSRKRDIIEGSQLNPSVSVSARYYGRLHGLVSEMIRIAGVEMNRTSSIVEDSSIASQYRMGLARTSKRVEKLFKQHAPFIVEGFMSGVLASSKSQLHKSLKEMSGGLSLKTDIFSGDVSEIVKASSTYNVELITTIPETFMDRLSGDVYRAIQNGRGLGDIYKSIKKYGAMSDRHARMIARDQTRKVFQDVNRERVQIAGVKKGKWMHHGGAREPRRSHIKMSGKIFDLDKGCWDAAEQRYVFPAELVNCGCSFAPVIDFGDEEDD